MNQRNLQWVKKRLLSLVMSLLMILSTAAMLPIEVMAEKSSQVLNLHYDFEDGTAGAELSVSALAPSASTWYTASAVEGLTYAADPDDATNTVVGSKGVISFADTDGALMEKRFSTEMKLRVNTMPTSGLSLISWGADSSLALLKMTSAGKLQLLKSDGSYTTTSKTLKVNAWNTIRVDHYLSYISATSGSTDLGWFVSLWVDDVYVTSSQITEPTASNGVSFLQNSDEYSVYVDDISLNTYSAARFDEVLTFEDISSNVTIAPRMTSALTFPNAYTRVRYSIFKTAANPIDSADRVLRATSTSKNGGYLGIVDHEFRLAYNAFIMSADFRFESFPTNVDGEGKVYPLLTYVRGTSSSTFFATSCKINGSGELLDHNGQYIGVTVEKGTWFNVAVHVNPASGVYDLYIDGKLIDTIDLGKKLTGTATTSWVRIFNADGSNGALFDAYIDDIQIYEHEYTSAIKDTVWDVDFDSLNEGVMTANMWNEASDVGSCADNKLGSNGKIVTFNGSKALKVSGMTSANMLDLKVGSGAYDPLKTSVVKASFDFNLESDEAKSGSHSLIKWSRYIDDNKTVKAIPILAINSEEKAVFCGKELDFTFTFNTTYEIEVTLNGLMNVASLKIDGKTLVNSIGVCSNTDTFDVEGASYFFDAYGAKIMMPYTGIYTAKVLDHNGKSHLSTAGKAITVNRLANGYSNGADMLRFFEGCENGSEMVYYVDNLKIEKDSSASVFSSDFTGWSLYGKPTEDSSDARFRFGNNGSWKTASDGTPYFRLWNGGHFSIFDKHLIFNGKDYEINADMMLNAPTDSTATTDIISYEYRYYNASGTLKTAYLKLVSVDKNGNIYGISTDLSGNENSELIATVNKAEMFNVKVVMHGAGEYGWDSFDVYVNGELAGAGFSIGNHMDRLETVTLGMVRFKGFTGELHVYRIAIDFLDKTLEDFVLDFEDDAATNVGIKRLGSSWKYPALGETRMDSIGNTVKTVEVLGEIGAKYFRVNHEKLTDNLQTCFDVPYAKVIDEDAYVIEASIRYSSQSASDMPVARICYPQSSYYSPLVYIDGSTNKLFMNLNGVNYELCDNDGAYLTVLGVDATDFTDVAILVDRNNSKYSVYVNGKLTYYPYDNEILPCADIAMHSISYTDTENFESFIRMLEIDEGFECNAMLDVDRVAVIAMPNGVSAEIIGSQTRSVLGNNTFDVRFVAGIDTLYGNAVGFEITAKYTDENQSYVKNSENSSTLVFDKITDGDFYVTAEALNSQHLATIVVSGIPADITVEFTVDPYVNRGGIKVYGQSYKSCFVDGEYVEISGDDEMTKILFIGNSMTYYNNMPTAIFAKFCEEAGHDVNVTSITKGGRTLHGHLTMSDEAATQVAAALSPTNVGAYDYVVLQEQSWRPLTRAAEFYDAVRTFNSRIKAIGATPILYVRPAYQEGHADIEANGLTYEQMVWKLAATHEAIADELDIAMAGVVHSFYNASKNNKDIVIYDADMAHPSYAGSYLAAATIYARIFNEDPTLISYNGSLDATVAATLRQIAKTSVFDTPEIPSEYKTTSEGVTNS